MRVNVLRPSETVALNTDLLDEMCTRLGYRKAEAAICTAMEDLAVLLQYACTLVKGDDLDSLNMTARQIEGLAERIGMVKLSRVAVDVYLLCGRDDKPALHATVSRMRRVGEQSLIAIWDREDLSI